MSGELVVYVAVAVALVAVALLVWVMDARRNREVQQDEGRLDTEPMGAVEPTVEAAEEPTDPTDPLHRRHR